MAVFKSTVSIESGTSTSQTKLSSTDNNNLNDGAILRKKKINSTVNTGLFRSSNASRGSYIYIKSSASNPKHTAIMVSSREQPLATLYPGEHALIPLSKELRDLSAITTYGTAELEYFYGSRGEDMGESILLSYRDRNSGAWVFFTMDAATGTPSGLYGTGVPYGEYPGCSVSGLVNNKGYILRFNSGAGDRNRLLFVNSKGQVIYVVDINTSYNSYYGGGKANLITWIGEGGNAIYFDGDNVYTHTFGNVGSIYIQDNWDQCTADGTFSVVITSVESRDPESLYLIKGASKKLIKSYNSNRGLYVDSYLYSYANFIAVETRNQNTEGRTLEIYSTKGTILKTVDFTGIRIGGSNFYFYGTGKLQIVYNEINGRKEQLFLNYNQNTGKFIGDDFKWKSTETGAYEVICDTYSTISGKNYNPESIAILTYGESGNSGTYFLDTEVKGLIEVTYIINNDKAPRNYTIEPRFERTCHISTKAFTSAADVVLLIGDYIDEGALTATRFTSTGEPTTFTIIPELKNYDVSNIKNGVPANYGISGDYHYIDFISKIKGRENLRDIIVFNSTNLLDKVSVYYDNYNGYSAYNLIYVVDWDSGKSWYFNTSTKKMVPSVQDIWDYWTPQYEGLRNLNNTGIVLPVRYFNDRTNETIYATVINRGVSGSEKEILTLKNSLDGGIYAWDFIVSTETIALGYKQNWNSTWKVKVFDLSLNLLYEIDTKKPNCNSVLSSGKINNHQFSDRDGNWTIYNFNRLLNVKDVLNKDNQFTQFLNNNGFGQKEKTK